MTGTELKQIRLQRNLSLSQFSQFCGLANQDNIRFMETGKKPITGPIAVLADAMRRGYLDSWLDELFGAIRDSQS